MKTNNLLDKIKHERNENNEIHHLNFKAHKNVVIYNTIKLIISYINK